MKLRDYQQAAVEAAFRYFREKPGNPCIVIPTGGGKTPVIAEVCRRTSAWGRVCVLAHVKELLEQSVDKLRAMDAGLDVGVYSAGLGRRDTGNRIVVAGIQSVYERVEEFGAFDLVIIDEAHLLSDDEDSRYRTFLREAMRVRPGMKVLGLTATPYRLGSGMICTPDGILQEVCFEVGIRPLINRGYLCDLITKKPGASVNCDAIGVRGGEFIAGDVERAFGDELRLQEICVDIVRYAGDRKSVLIFAACVSHAEAIAQLLQKRTGEEVGIVTGMTPSHYRAELLARFRGEEVQRDLFGEKQPRLKYLVNVNVLTTGFDAPNVDCIALVRPTMSPGLYYQMVGRGLRIHAEKKHCLVLDYGENILRHGPVDNITIRQPGQPGRGTAPVVVCPQCRTVNVAASRVCKECQFLLYTLWEPKEKYTETASDKGVLTGQVTETEHAVIAVGYYRHEKRNNPDAVPTIRVEYSTEDYKTFREWICPEHDGYAKKKFSSWWFQRSLMPEPDSVEVTLAIADAGFLAMPTMIRVKETAGSKFSEITGVFPGEAMSQVREVRLERDYDDNLLAIALDVCEDCLYWETESCRGDRYPSYNRESACPAFVFQAQCTQENSDDLPF